MKLKIGDIITNDGESRKVLEVLTQTVLLSFVCDFDSADTFYTKKELLKYGWVFPEVKWKPEEGKKYWYTCSDGTIEYTYNNSLADRLRISVDNCYQTEALAQEALKRVLAAYKG